VSLPAWGYAGGPGAWLGSAYADGLGLCLPGRPYWRAADLHLWPEQVVVAAGPARAHLQWDDHLAGPGGDGEGAWWVGLVSGFAPAVLVVTRESAALDGLLGARRASPADELLGWLRRRRRGEAVLNRSVSTAAVAEADTLAALVMTLATRPRLRARLAEPARVSRLVADMAGGALENIVGRPARRDEWETVSALAALGYLDPVGRRPVPGDHRDTVPVVVERVAGELARRPGATVSLDRIAAAVHRHYEAIRPWPFWSLTDPADPPAPTPRPPSTPSDTPPRPLRPSWWRDEAPWDPPTPD
jgi:hypothetical protein